MSVWFVLCFISGWFSYPLVRMVVQEFEVEYVKQLRGK
jgi:hypothetical protein